MQALVGVLAGLVFGVGLALGGMTQPTKVIGFLDATGDWDPSLAFVMLGAVGVYAPAYRLITGYTLPLFGQRYLAAASSEIDARLLFGAALFGVGWGLSGYCPGPAIVALGAFTQPALVFGASMALGMLLFAGYQRARDRRVAPPQGQGEARVHTSKLAS